MTGRAAIVAAVSAKLDGARTLHSGHDPQIDVLGPELAKGIWSMEDRIVWPDRRFHGWGHYHETYRRIDGRWLIAHCRLELAALRP